MAKERRKITVAGPLWMGVQYAAAHSKDPDTNRAAKSQISSPARESLNARLSWQKLMLVLACNFSPGDLVATLTYRDGDLPRTREKADKRLTAFLRRLRSARKQAGEALRYIRVTEGYHSGGRLHHHLIINSTGDDYQMIKGLWERNGDNVEFQPLGTDGYSQWAQYLTKEPRTLGRRHVGDRTWRTSLHMRKPVIYYDYVHDTDHLQPPAGAHVLDRTECQNCYGRFVSITALSEFSESEN